jgi:hypothetical protein
MLSNAVDWNPAIHVSSGRIAAMRRTVIAGALRCLLSGHFAQLTHGKGTNRQSGVLLSVGLILGLSLLGAPVAQAGWLAPVDISDAADHIGSPHVVLDSGGNATAVWDRWSGNDTVVESAYRPAGESWQTPILISDAPGESSGEGGEGAHDAQSPRIAVDAEGDVTVVWERSAGTSKLLVQSVYRPSGGSWQTPVTIGEVDTMMAPEPWVAVDSQGDATATWTAGGTIYSAFKPAGGSWQVPVQLSGAEAFVPQAAVDAQGDATVVWVHYNGSTFVVQSAYRPAGGSWETPTDLSQSGEEGGDPQIALDAHGDAMVVWDGHPSEYEDVARMAYRPVGGGWQAPVDISDEGEQIQALQVAFDAQGDAMVVWAGSTREAGGYDIARAAYRPVGGAWEAPTSLSEDGGNAYPSDLVFDAAGNVAVLWQRDNGTSNILQADYRPAGGVWQTPTNLSKDGSNATDAVLVLDAPGDETAADGDATAVWVAGNDDGACDERLRCVGSYLVQAAGYDTDEAPVEEGLEVPATGSVGTPVEVSVPTTDVWSPLLEFGDGTSTSGATSMARAGDRSSHSTTTPEGTRTVHTYSQPGRYSVTFSGTEVLGYRTSAHRTILIGPADGSSGSEDGSTGSEEEEQSEPESEPPDSETESSDAEASGENENTSDSDNDLTGAGAENMDIGTAPGEGDATGGGPAGIAMLPGSLSPVSHRLVLKLAWSAQTRKAILASGTIRVVCHMSEPGVCAVRGAAGRGQAKLGSSGGREIAIKLTRAALREIRNVGVHSLTFLVTARTYDHRIVTKAITVTVL